MTETLFAEAVQVLFKNQDCADRKVQVKVTVEIQTTTSPLHRKDLLIRLTDDHDPFFLYDLCLSEEDFQVLKAQQGLLVDFASLPQRFIGLLGQCKSEEVKNEPKFLLVFTSSDNSTALLSGNQYGVLKIIETNPFKHLSHLSLNFASGNDSDVKKYLASRLKLSLEKQQNLEQKLNKTDTELSQKIATLRQQLSDKNVQLEKLQNESTGLVNNY